MEFAKLTEDEDKAVERIIERAAVMEREYGSKLDRLSLRMDLEATHAKCPLDLKRLAEFPDFDFAHDIYGIMGHLNRKTGELENCFVPRCAIPDPEKRAYMEAKARVDAEIARTRPWQ